MLTGNVVLYKENISHIYNQIWVVEITKPMFYPGQTFHFFPQVSATSLSTDRSRFLLAVGVANDTAPRITELLDITVLSLVLKLPLRLGPKEFLI